MTCCGVRSDRTGSSCCSAVTGTSLPPWVAPGPGPTLPLVVATTVPELEAAPGPGPTLPLAPDPVPWRLLPSFCVGSPLFSSEYHPAMFEPCQTPHDSSGSPESSGGAASLRVARLFRAATMEDAAATLLGFEPKRIACSPSVSLCLYHGARRSLPRHHSGNLTLL